jgi:hypothetical protein
MNGRRILRSAAAAAAVLAHLHCSQDRGAAGGGEVPPPAARALPGAAWRLEPALLTVGEVDGPAESVFHRIGSALLTDNARLIIADRLVPGDSVAAWDGIGRRVSWWSFTGEFGRSVSISRETAPETDIVALFDDGWFIGLEYPVHRGMPAGTSRVDSIGVVLLAPDGSLTRRLGRYRWNTVHAVANPADAGRTMYTGLPFDPAGLVAASRADFRIAYGASTIIHRVTGRGDADTMSLGPFAAPPLDAAIREAYQRRRLEAARPETRPALRPFLERLPYPDSLPLFDAAIADDAGNLWLRRFTWLSTDSALWTVHAPDGRAQTHLFLPADLRPMQITRDRIVALRTGELGVEIVTVHALSRR